MGTSLATLNPGAWAKCAPHIVEDFDRCSGLTTADLKPILPSEFDSIYLSSGKPRVDAHLVEADFIGRSCFPKVNGLYEFIMATRRNWSKSMQGSRQRRDGRIEFEPFLKMRRKGPINNQWWRAEFKVSGAAGAVGDGAPTTVAGEFAYAMVSLSDSVPASPAYFPVPTEIFFSSRTDVDVAGTNTGAIQQSYGAGKVTRTAIGTSGALYVYVTPMTLGYNSVLPGQDLGNDNFNATAFPVAVVTRGTPNVSDYEKFCSQIPALNSNQDVYFWVGTTRWSLCESEIVNEYIRRVLADNKLYREYYHVEDVEMNRQITEDFQRRIVEQFFYGKPLANQTANDWPNLEAIDLEDALLLHGASSPVVGRRANPVGIINQLAECGRVIDKAGANLTLGGLQEDIYLMDRIRSDNGIQSDTIECFTNSLFARKIEAAFIAYYKAKSIDTMRMNMPFGSNGPLGFRYNEFELDYPAGKKLRVVTHPYFDDMLDAHRRVQWDGDKSLAANGNQLWFIDWSTNYAGILDTNKVTNVTGDVQDLAKIHPDYACVMKTKKRSWRLTSQTWTVVSECPMSSLVYNNFSGTIDQGTVTKIGVGRVPWSPDPGVPVTPE